MKPLKTILGMRATLVALLCLGLTALASGKQNTITVTVDKPKIRALVPDAGTSLSKVDRRANLLEVAQITAAGSNEEMHKRDAGTAIVPQIYFVNNPPTDADAAIVVYQDLNNVNPPVLLLYFFQDGKWDLFPGAFK